MITIHTKTITEFTAVCYDIVDITAKLKARIRAVGMGNGTATLFVNDPAAALTTIEDEPGLSQDLTEFLEKYISADRRYNGFARLRASLFEPSLAIPIVDGAPSLGNWQEVTLMDFDNRPRNRDVIVQLIGECE